MKDARGKKEQKSRCGRERLPLSPDIFKSPPIASVPENIHLSRQLSRENQLLFTCQQDESANR